MVTNHPLPLDSYLIDTTYGDDFTSGSLSGIWTRRNVPSSEVFQLGPTKTWIRSDFSSLAKGDGYYQTAPAGDWTFAMSFLVRPSSLGFGISVVDTNGTGVNASFYNSPAACLVSEVTTYTTYGGSFQAAGPTDFLGTDYYQSTKKTWVALRKSGTSYFASYSLDGELWSPESAGLTWAGTVNRVGAAMSALVTPGAAQFNEIDWFNKIA